MYLIAYKSNLPEVYIILLKIAILSIKKQLSIANKSTGSQIPCESHPQRNHFEILLNQPEIRFYLHFPIYLDPNGRPFGSKSIGKC